MVMVAIAVIIAISATGPKWYEDLVHRRRATPAVSPPALPTAHAPALGPPVSITPMQPVGIDSSTSPVPLSLILTRTQRGRNSREGFAQIGVRPESPQTYSSGALLVNGARLTEIYDTYVVLERDGHSARLYLQGSQQPSSDSSRDLLSVGATAERSLSTSVSHDTLSLYMRPSPEFSGNQLQGYTLYPGRDPSLFSELGLQSGDLLTHLNGEAITEATDALSTLQTLLKGAVLNADIQRDGGTRAVTLDGRIFLRSQASHGNASESSERTGLTL